ncbi:MAG: ABC transporter permease [Opitutales bacterium]
MSNVPITVFTAESTSLRPARLAGEMLRGAWEGRRLAYRLFRKDLKAEFADSLLGYTWNFANPLILAAIFILMQKDGILRTDTIAMPYPVYVVCGMLLFQTFIQSINLPLSLLVRSGNLINNVRVPAESLVGSVLLRLGFDALFYIPIILATCWLFDVLTWQGALWLGVLYPSMILLGSAFGLFLAPLNVIYSDCSKLVQNLTRPLMFICPTFYRPSDGMPWLEAILTYNPIGVVMDNIRLLTVQGEWMNLPAFVCVLGAAALLFLTGWLLLHVSVTLLAQKVSA